MSASSSSNCDNIENKTVKTKLNENGEEKEKEEEDSIPGPKPPKAPKKEYIEILLNPPEERIKKKNKNICERILSRLKNREVFGNSLSLPNIFELNKRNSSVHQRDLKAHTGCVNAVDFSPNEEWIVSGGDDLKVRLWKTVDCCTSETPSLTSVTMKSVHQSNIFALRFSHKTERVYSAGNDHRLLVHDMRTLGRLCTYRAASSIYHISTHPVDDNMIAASSDDRNVYLFDLRGGEGDGMCTKLKQEGRAYSVCWNPLNHNIVAVCNEKTGLVIYDLRMGINNYVEAGKITRRAICSDWSPNGEALFCVMSRSNPVVFNLSTSEYVHLRDPNYSNFCTIKSCTFAGHNFMCTGSDDWNIYVWEMPTDWSDKNDENENTSNAFTVLRGHRSIVNHVKYGSKSGLMLSCGVEKIVKCWSPLPLFSSYSNPKLRTKLSNARLFPYVDMGDPHGDSDIEEDLSTLHRFDYYYEIQSLRMRQSNGIVEDSDSDSDMDSNYSSGFLLYQFQNNANNGSNNGDDQESYFSGISAGGDVEDSSTSENASISSQPLGHSVGGGGGHNNFDDAF
ncbi:unnamed protein product [Meloidogyne enterolobii]|uniref:Uncharacterized protein n=1 Tax=Meloidogyne enterolobii TaxID=390850 RepID=A0ACB0XYX1_MELEN